MRKFLRFRVLIGAILIIGLVVVPLVYLKNRKLVQKLVGTNIVVYVMEKRECVEPLFRAFEKNTKAHILATYFTSQKELIDRLQSEKSAPKADLVLANDASLLEELQKKGLLQPYYSRQSRDIRVIFRDKKLYWQGFMGRPWVIAYNTQAIYSYQAPKSIFEMSLPQWNGQSAFPDPSIRPMASYDAALKNVLGKTNAELFIARACTNGSAVYPDSASVVKAIANKSRIWGIAEVDDVIDAACTGHPVAWIIPDQNPLLPKQDLGAMLLVSGIAIPAKAPHIEAAKTLYEFILSPKRAKLIEASAYTRLTLHMAANLDKRALKRPILMNVHYEKTAR